jgi:hypothetical protein
MRASCFIAFGLICFSAAHAAPPGKIVPRVVVDRNSISLSERVQVTLSLEGPSPLRIELPEPLLSAESSVLWRIRPGKESAIIEKLPGDRERWSRMYRLDPYSPGDPLQLSFAPAKVNGEEVDWPMLAVRVQTSISELKAENARPITGIEELPPPAPTSGTYLSWTILAVCGLLLLVAGTLAARWRSRKQQRILSADEWAKGALDQVERDIAAESVQVVLLADRVANIVREFISRRFGWPALHLTTVELLTKAELANWPSQSVASLADLLGHCDRAKFAGEAPDIRELVALAQAWVRNAI